MSEIEQIERDMQSIENAFACIEKMPAVRKDRSMSKDLDIVRSDLHGLLWKLQKKLDKAKDSKEVQGE